MVTLRTLKWMLLATFLFLSGCPSKSSTPPSSGSSGTSSSSAPTPSVKRSSSSAKQLLKQELPALLKGLQHSNARVRMLAIRALAHRRKEANTIVPLLLKRLRSDSVVTVRFAAADSLGKLQALPNKTIPALQAGLQDKGWPVQVACAVSLKRFGDKALSALPALTALWKHPKAHWMARQHSLKTLLALHKGKALSRFLTKALMEEKDAGRFALLLEKLQKKPLSPSKPLLAKLLSSVTRPREQKRALLALASISKSYPTLFCQQMCDLLLRKENARARTLAWTTLPFCKPSKACISSLSKTPLGHQATFQQWRKKSRKP